MSVPSGTVGYSSAVTGCAPAVFYYDLASPYAYLASHRVEAMLGADVVWQPVLVGAIHRHFRRVSWGATPALRAAGIAEIEERAAALGLSLTWPRPYPASSLAAMRAATWAHEQGQGRSFARAAWSLAFEDGADLTDRQVIVSAARRVGLDAVAAEAALQDPAVKEHLRAATAAAIDAGVYGVPTFDAGGLLWWGDHLLEAARAGMTSSDSAGTPISDRHLLGRKSREELRRWPEP